MRQAAHRWVFALCFFLACAFPVAAQSLNLQSEVALAEYVRDEILLSQRLLLRTPYNDIADRVMWNLLTTDSVRRASLPYRWEWFVIDAPQTPNAGAMVGGKFILTSGLGKVLADEESLWAAVMAHEVAHALYRHPLALLERAAEYQRLQSRMANAESAGEAIGTAIGAAVYGMLASKFSRDEESRADQLGLLLMADAGYDPDFAFAMQQAMRRKLGDTSKLQAFFSDHPRWVTREQRTYKSYEEARAVYLTAVTAGRKRGGSPPAWAMIGKPVMSQGKGPTDLPGLLIRTQVTVHNAEGKNVAVLAFLSHDGNWISSQMDEYRSPGGYLFTHQEARVNAEIGQLGEIVLFLPYQAVDPAKLGKKAEVVVVVADTDSILSESEPVKVKLPKPTEIRKMLGRER